MLPRRAPRAGLREQTEMLDNAGARTLHIGCGPSSKDGDVGIDILDGPAVDIVHDLNRFPWPIDDEQFDVILCKDVLEHLIDIPGVLREISRVARDGATIHISVPTGSSPDLFTDPTHIRGFGHRSFDYFDPDKELYSYGYSDLRIRVESFEFVSLEGRAMRWPDRLMTIIANRFPQFYEFRLCHLYPMRTLHFVLRVEKSSPNASRATGPQPGRSSCTS
jgi:SAM-dependent methyltransferase